MNSWGPASDDTQRTETAKPRGIRLLGVPVRLHFTFVILLIFLATLGLRGGESAVYNVLYILALFTSVVLHELGHVLVSRRYGIGTQEIVLYPIGGVAKLERSPRPKEELWIALAGPAVNIVIAIVLGLGLVLTNGTFNLTALAEPDDSNVIARIMFGNLILAAFNMIPAFPMDGGRVLRAVMARYSPEEVATRRAAAAGRVFAILIGLYGLISGQFMLLFIAMFVYLGATQESAAVTGRVLTEGVTVRAAMITDYRTLGHGNTIREAANMLLATSQQDFPVMLGNQVVGLLGRNALLKGMAVDGPEGYVAGIMDREYPRILPDVDLQEVLPMMAQTSCALVMDAEDNLLGLVTRENVSEFMMLRRFGMEAAQHQRA